HITAHDAVNHVHACDNAPEDSIAAVKVRLRAVRDEPLRAASVFAGQGHPDRATLIRNFVNLAANLVARLTVAVAARVAALNHEVGHDAMKGDVIKIAVARK